MHYYEVAPNQIIRAGSSVFTYSSDKPVKIGALVTVEVGKKEMTGVVVSETKKPNYATKQIIKTIYDNPLPAPLVELSLWIAKYYTTPLATVLQTILPSGITKNRRSQSDTSEVYKRERTNIVFNKEQSEALKILHESKPGTILLQGITGSGKTEVYIETAKRTIDSGRSVIVLVPEIALTSQIISEFSNHFDDIIVTHSKMSEAKRHITWQKVLESTKPMVVIGPRSALFLPLRDVGVIIVDEAHEPSFKQEQSPRYSALRAATILGRLHKSLVIFGSATPSIADRYLADQSKRPVLLLTKPARKNTIPPSVNLIDMTKRDNFSNYRFLSKQLEAQITETLRSGKQSLLFHNRRGSASTTLCKDCGWTADCPNCFLPLTLHADKYNLTCHICGFKDKIPTSCPVCGSADIIHKGIGTKLIESELRKIFPKANIARFDADNTENENVNARYKELYEGDIDIAIGTQVIGKGLDLPHLRTVGVIQADAGLSLPDYASSERTFQLLAQVVGRVGRNEHPTNVIVQTYQPTNPAIKYGLTQDYASFYEFAINERKKGLYPPFTFLLKLTCVYKTESASIKNSKALADELRSKLNKSVRVLGPTPAFYERQHGTYRWQIILKSPKRELLIDAMKLVPATNWQSELDPNSLL
ncbi:MAG TPA: primosomal protein N' [Candidatus Saccharibacteria bacterium]|nr:primosomal protein N' [Candidatus Saccharibacteria bacterium]HRQ06940.1 primosomal protein N' [Candidatus Saccharibacteria bacterium]